MKAEPVDKIITLAKIADAGRKLSKTEKEAVNSCKTIAELEAYERLYQ